MCKSCINCSVVYPKLDFLKFLLESLWPLTYLSFGAFILLTSLGTRAIRKEKEPFWKPLGAKETR